MPGVGGGTTAGPKGLAVALFQGAVQRVAGLSPRAWLELIVGVVLAVTVLLRSWQLDRANERAAASALAADTLRATLDTSRVLALRLDGDRQAAQRQVVQVAQVKDSIDEQLGLVRIAKAELVAQMEALTVNVRSAAPVTELAGGERAAEFVVDSAPYHVKASVYMPEPLAAATLSLNVTVDSLALEARVGCAAADATGISSAFVTVIGPKWAPLSLRRVEQDPGLCRSPALEPAQDDGRSLFRKIVDRFGVSAGYGLHGPDVVVGFRVWP